MDMTFDRVTVAAKKEMCIALYSYECLAWTALYEKDKERGMAKVPEPNRGPLPSSTRAGVGGPNSFSW